MHDHPHKHSPHNGEGHHLNPCSNHFGDTSSASGCPVPQRPVRFREPCPYRYDWDSLCLGFIPRFSYGRGRKLLPRDGPRNVSTHFPSTAFQYRAIHSANIRGPHRERLYYATGFGLVQCVKALMSYEDEVTLSPSFLQERKIDPYKGSASSLVTYEARKRRG